MDIKKRINEIVEFGPCCTLAEAAELLGLQRDTVRSYITKGFVQEDCVRKSGGVNLVSYKWILEHQGKRDSND